MRQLLRVVDGARWDFVDEVTDWAQVVLPAAPFGDLRGSPSNKLSVWVVEEDRSNLERIIAGMAATRGNIEKFDGRLVDEAAVLALGIDIQKSSGSSRDREANRNWHADLIQMDLRKLEAFALLLAQHGTPLEHGYDEVKGLIFESVRAEHIRLEDLRPRAPGEHSVWVQVSEAIQEQGAQEQNT